MSHDEFIFGWMQDTSEMTTSEMTARGSIAFYGDPSLSDIRNAIKRFKRDVQATFVEPRVVEYRIRVMKTSFPAENKIFMVCTVKNKGFK